MTGLAGYDQWKLAAPPFEDGPPPHPNDCRCEDCDPEWEYLESLALAAERGDFEHGELGEAGA